MLKILIVEDDKFISTILSFFVKNLGHQLVGRSASGTEALELVQKHCPDVVLMDIHLEGELDGIQTAERIQREHEIPVIFVSSDTSTGIVERAIIANSYGYLIKPIQKRELGITIDLAYYKHKVALDQKRREQGFRQFISDAAIPIIIVSNGRIRYLNMNALDLFHSHYIEDIMGLPLLNFVGEKSKEAFRVILDKEFDQGENIPRFTASIRGLHKKEVDVAVCGSWVKFNNTDSLQLIMTDLSEENKNLKNLDIYRKILKNGMGAYFELNSLFEVIDYNDAFQDMISSAIEIKGNSLFNLKPFIDIDSGIMADGLKDKNVSDFDVELHTSFQILHCKAYVMRNAKGVAERVIVSVQRTEMK